VSHKYLHTHYVKRGVFNELTDQRFDVVQKQPASRSTRIQEQNAAKASRAADSKVSYEGLQSMHLMSLEAENSKLKSEIAETSETVEILKNVIADYLKRDR
jgi:septal ring factor EnvC (AmiA/AmiB activator)